MFDVLTTKFVLLSCRIKLIQQPSRAWVCLWLFISQGVSYKSILINLLKVMLLT